MVTQKEIACLRWISAMLEAKKVPYQIVGGAACRIYGSARVLNDIDLYVPEILLPIVADSLGHLVTWGPSHHRDDHWDLTYLKAKYEDLKIEIAAADSTKFWSHSNNRWVAAAIDFTNCSRIKLDVDLVVSVMPCDQLISYKKLLGRSVDLADILELEEKVVLLNQSGQCSMS